MKKFILPLTVLGILVFAACSQKAAPAKTETPKETPKAKGTTYMANVQSLVLAKCAPCHIPSKGGNKGDFENYSSAMKYAAEMVDRISLVQGSRGFMPMRGTKLSDDEIAVFKNWVKDGLLEK